VHELEEQSEAANLRQRFVNFPVMFGRRQHHIQHTFTLSCIVKVRCCYIW